MFQKMRVFLLFLPALALAGEGREIAQNVVALQGIPYARQPVGIHRFEDSVPIAYSEDLPASWKRCISNKIEPGRGEDCLFLSSYRHKEMQKKAKTLVILTNDELDDEKIAGIVSKKLNVIVASAREGVLSAFAGAPYGVSDVVSLFSFLKENKERLFIGDVTIWAEGFLAEMVAAAQHKIELKGAIFINGYATSRAHDSRSKLAKTATYLLRRDTLCDLPSFDQSIDCLRSKPVEELVEKSNAIVKSLSPFGNPYRPPRGYIPEKTIPTILGIYSTLSKDYPDQFDFDVNYSTSDFKKFLARLVPDSLHQNAPLLRRLIQHQYINSQGDKKDTYFLYQRARDILLDREFRVPAQLVIDHYVRFKNKLWVLEYAIDSTNPGCLHPGANENFKGFCERLLQYFTRFATEGAPTAESCEQTNPTFPMMGAAKRPYFVRLQASGQPVWEHHFHKPAAELWNNLLPAMDNLELTGRRDAQFADEKEMDPLEVEDDVQMWHENAADDQTVLTEEKVLNDMPHKMEL